MTATAEKFGPQHGRLGFTMCRDGIVFVEGPLLGQPFAFNGERRHWELWWAFNDWGKLSSAGERRQGDVAGRELTRDDATAAISELVGVEPAELFAVFPFGFDVVSHQAIWQGAGPRGR